MNEELHEQEIRQLERELRSYGDPYASPEPDERYFANFRARVMERIGTEQPVGLMQHAREFFFGSPLRMAFSGSSLVAGTFLYFALQSSPEQPVAHKAQPEQPIMAPQAIEQAPVAQQPTPMPAPMSTEQVVAPKNATVNTPPQAPHPAPVQNTIPEASPTQNIAEVSAEFDEIDPLSMSDENDPVSYDKLSMEELEAVLKILETEPLTIQ